MTHSQGYLTWLERREKRVSGSSIPPPGTPYRPNTTAKGMGEHPQKPPGYIPTPHAKYVCICKSTGKIMETDGGRTSARSLQQYIIDGKVNIHLVLPNEGEKQHDDFYYDLDHLYPYEVFSVEILTDQNVLLGIENPPIKKGVVLVELLKVEEEYRKRISSYYNKHRALMPIGYIGEETKVEGGVLRDIVRIPFYEVEPLISNLVDHYKEQCKENKISGWTIVHIISPEVLWKNILDSGNGIKDSDKEKPPTLEDFTLNNFGDINSIIREKKPLVESYYNI